MKILRFKSLLLSLVLTVIFILSVFSGCMPKKPGVYVAEKNVKYSDLQHKDVLVAINGSVLTKGDFEKYVDLRMSILKLLNPQIKEEMAGGGLRLQTATRAFNEWQTKEFLVQRAKALKLKISDEVRDVLHENMAPRLRKKIGKEEDAKRVLGSAYLEYAREKERDLLINELYRSEGLLSVESNELARLSARLAKYNERASATNAFVLARGTNIFNAIKSGLDFTEAFKKYNEDKDLDAGGDMGWCFANEIPQDEIRNVIFSAKPGELLGPFDTADGLHIVKVTDYSGGGPTAGGMLEPPKVRYSQLTLRLAELADEMTDSEMIKVLRKQNIRKFQLSQVKNLREASVIEYPNGTNLFVKPSRTNFRR